MTQNYKLVNDKDVPDNVIIPEEGWAVQIDKVIIGVNHIKFADEENEDGTYNVDIDYDVLNFDDLVEGDVPENIGEIIGEIVLDMLETAMKVRDMKEIIKEVDKEKGR